MGLSRPSQGECGAFVRTRRRCKKLSKLAASDRRGCPGQARARRVRVVSDLSFTTDPAQPDSRGLVPAIPRRMRSIRPHAGPSQETFEGGGFRSAWMPGTSPGTTREGCERPGLYNRSCPTGLPWHKAGHDVLGLQKVKYCNRILFLGQRCKGRGRQRRYAREILSTLFY